MRIFRKLRNKLIWLLGGRTYPFPSITVKRFSLSPEKIMSEITISKYHLFSLYENDKSSVEKNVMEQLSINIAKEILSHTDLFRLYTEEDHITGAKVFQAVLYVVPPKQLDEPIIENKEARDENRENT